MQVNIKKKYAVADESGLVVYYTNDFSDAERVAEEINQSLEAYSMCGCSSILCRDEETKTYRLWFATALPA